MPPRTKSSRPSSRFPFIIITILTLLSISFYIYSSQTSITTQHPDTIPISQLPRTQSECTGPIIQKRIGIIGAGSAGTSTAYFLARSQAVSGSGSGSRNAPCTNLSITIFERNSYIGGRSTTVYPYYSSPQQQTLSGQDALHAELEGQPPLELGGSVFVKVNTNLLHAAAALNLTVQNAGHAQPRLSEYGLGIWDGNDFRVLFRERDSWWVELGRLFYRYGLSPLWTQRAMKDTVARFQRMYETPLFPWRSLTEVVRAVGLDGETGVSGRVFLTEKKISDAFADDLVQASTRVNYAQNLEQIHAVETMVCMAAEGGTMSIKGGNWQIYDRMARTSGADVKVNTSVLGIASVDTEKADDGARFEVTYRTTSTTSGIDNESGSEEIARFDGLVLAAPLQYSDIDTTKLSAHLQSALPQPISYVHLHVTLLATRHRISPVFFGKASHNEIPSTILTTLPTDSDTKTKTKPEFFSISTLRNLTHPLSGEREYAYKIFSAERVSASFLARLFDLRSLGSNSGASFVVADEQDQMPLTDKEDVSDAQLVEKEISWLYPHTWNSYPYLATRTEFDGPELVRGAGLWYTSGIEGFIATMETSSLSGRNAAALVWEWLNSEGSTDGVRTDI